MRQFDIISRGLSSTPWRQFPLLGFVIIILHLNLVKAQKCSVFNTGKLHVTMNPLILYAKGIGKPECFIHFGEGPNRNWKQKKPLTLQSKFQDTWTKNVIFATYYQHRQEKLACNVTVNNDSDFRLGLVPDEELYLTFGNSSGAVTWSLCGSDESIYDVRYETGSSHPLETGSTVQLDSGMLTPPHVAAVIPTAWPAALLPKDYVTWILVSSIAVLVVIICILSVILHKKRKQ
ncbi:unnamed protein product [Meganyctiphanes norvegica]|uniref:Uncharacterized protein n=1 Tax=Meganyctiphanes norvegica TaxID=48144 RepID=A0AAV2R7K1_MEGNR